MNSILYPTLTSRKIIAPFLEKYTVEQLNTIPEGFSNNLIWNIGHIIVAQQMLVYKLSGLPMLVSDELVEKYKKGTKPEQPVTEQEVEEIKALLFKTLEQTELDLDNDLFKNYMEYTTSTGGHVLKTAEDAMRFNTFHEGVHIGIMLSIRKFL